MRILSCALISVAALAQTACSNPFGGAQSEVQTGHTPGVATNPDDPDASPTPTPPPRQLEAGKGAEFVPNSGQGVATSGGRFKVFASVSNSASEVYGVTPNLHDKIFSNVQGEILSEGDGL